LSTKWLPTVGLAAALAFNVPFARTSAQ